MSQLPAKRKTLEATVDYEGSKCEDVQILPETFKYWILKK